MVDGGNDQLSADCERLIWECNPKSLREQATADGHTWAGSVQAELRKFGMTANLLTPVRQRPYLNAAVVMMAKDEADIIAENLRWLYFLGLRRLIVLDNNSSDRTFEIINRFQHDCNDCELLSLQDPIVRYMQAEKTTGLYRLAVSVWPDIRWVFPIDADEFLVATKGLQVLDMVSEGVDALTIPKVIHFQAKSKARIPGGSFFQNMSCRSPLFVVPPKIVARSNLFMTILQGNHKVRLIDNRPPVYDGAFQLGLYYREYPNRGFEHFLRKVRNGGRAILAAEDFLGRGVGGEHWKAYYHQFLENGERGIMEMYEREWIKEPGEDFVLDLFTACEGIDIHQRNIVATESRTLQLLPSRFS